MNYCPANRVPKKVRSTLTITVVERIEDEDELTKAGVK
jgi:hypothetical protein